MILIPAKLSTQIKNAEAEFNNPIATQSIESIKKKMPFDNLWIEWDEEARQNYMKDY